jgi:hypothetical protein
MKSTLRSRPGIRIVDLLLWTLGCALGLLGFRAYQALTYSLIPKYRPLGLAYNLIMGMVFGAILAGAGVALIRKWRGDPRALSLPGHWLLVFGLAAAFAESVALVVYLFFKDPSFFPPLPYWTHFRVASSPSNYDIYHQVAGWGAGAVASLAFFWYLRRRLPWPWLAVFLGFFLTAVTLSAGHFFYIYHSRFTKSRSGLLAWCSLSVHVYAAFLLLCSFAILAAAAWDLRCGRRTDGLHWIGIAVWLAIATIQIVTYSYVA